MGLLRALQDTSLCCSGSGTVLVQLDKKGISKLQKSLRLGGSWARTGVLQHWSCYLTPLSWLDLQSRQSSASVEGLKLVGLLQQHLWWIWLFAKWQFFLNTGKCVGALQSSAEVKSLFNYCPLGERFFLKAPRWANRNKKEPYPTLVPFLQSNLSGTLWNTREKHQEQDLCTAFCCPQPAAWEPGCCLWRWWLWPYAPKILNLGRGKALCSWSPKPHPNYEFFFGEVRNTTTTLF